jgi:inner membrane protein
MKIGSGAFTKGVMVLLVALVVLIPVQLLRNLVEERSSLRDQAVASVARGWGGKQRVGGPILMIPTTMPGDDGRPKLVRWYVMPESLALKAELKVLDEKRKLGVYEVPVYRTHIHATATFDIAEKIVALLQSAGAATVHLDNARLVLPISDPGGVRDLKATGAAIGTSTFEPERSFVTGAFAIPLLAGSGLDKGEQTFELEMEIAGTQSLAFLPTSRSTIVQLSGNWVDPGYTRGLLPEERTVKDGRFSALWKVLDLNRSFGNSWFGDQVSEPVLEESAFGVDLVHPVDLYQRTDRSVKYAGLFIALSMLTLFVWEHLARRPLHPIQYGLMGLALSVFYLLLLALAEHIGFDYAYISAAAALCILLGLYLSGAFASAPSGAGATTVFAGVYALLYLLVTSENYSLLVGSLALFALLAVAMLLTRKLDWYQATARPREE